MSVEWGGMPRPAQPVLSTDAPPNDPQKGDNRMDEHPVDVLRLYLASGVISSMMKLNAATRADYVKSVEAVARASTVGAEVHLEGLVSISHDDWIPVKTSMSLPVAASRAPGRQVDDATRKPKALNKPLHPGYRDLG